MVLQNLLQKKRINKIAIVVLAKIPIPGFAKTRIALSEGVGIADNIYLELLSVTSQIVNQYEYHVAFTGGQKPESLRKYFDRAISFFVQDGETLGERLRNASNHLFNEGYSGVVAIGCDCPYLSTIDLSIAVNEIEKGNDVVIGPALDGGYYLIGIKPSAIKIFDVTSWSQPTLFSETMGVVFENNLDYQILSERSDVDTMIDYVKWKQSLTDNN